MILSPICYRRK